MTYSDFQIALIKLNLSIRELAHLLNMNPNSISNYKGSGNIPRQLSIIIILMLEMKKHGLNYMEILKHPITNDLM